MKNCKTLTLLASLLVLTTAASGQTAEMADTFRSEGKIYVVVVIVLLVLAGLIAYLLIIDRKVGRLEKKIDSKTKTK
jgi:hypothetical protein